MLTATERPQRIMIVTDAWEPQVNGVATALSRTVAELRRMGCAVEVVTPWDGYRTIPLITYSEIRVPIMARDDVERRFLEFAPDAVHIATEGPLGWYARAVCDHFGFPFTSSYHTQFPEYVSARWSWIPLWAGYRYVRKFHDKSGAVLVATPTMREQLTQWRIRNVTPWSLGVDTEQFHPRRRAATGAGAGAATTGGTGTGVYRDLPGPVFLYVGRLAVEKNVEAFLDLDLPGSKVVVGDGPARADLEAAYPGAHFRGRLSGDDLAQHFADADVLVFPSRTDTFGLVILEAMASGTPVAGFDAPGPRDLIPGSGAGAVDDDLRAACLAALACSREETRRYAELFSWRACAEAFYDRLDVPPPPVRERIWVRGIQRLPGLGLTGLNMPSLTVPSLTLPHLTRPTLNLPSLPSLSSLNLPSLNLPGRSRPGPSRPGLSRPSLTLPGRVARLPELLPASIPRTVGRAVTRVRRIVTDRPTRTRRP
ncbi:glycosyltransferase family 1 protein [Promicromonospora sp. NPDC050262]|uniref:glycosyltransferase family 4 protein n=1 Tax=Promicromonospora sp. NPDC050262 TaxID=3155036 RepID=UPI0033C61634